MMLDEGLIDFRVVFDQALVEGGAGQKECQGKVSGTFPQGQRPLIQGRTRDEVSGTVPDAVSHTLGSRDWRRAEAQRMRATVRAPSRRSSRWAARRVATMIAMIEQEKAAARLVAPQSSSSSATLITVPSCC
jgi:hypothetical protein